MGSLPREVRRCLRGRRRKTLFLPFPAELRPQGQLSRLQAPSLGDVHLHPYRVGRIQIRVLHCHPPRFHHADHRHKRWAHGEAPTPQMCPTCQLSRPYLSTLFLRTRVPPQPRRSLAENSLPRWTKPSYHLCRHHEKKEKHRKPRRQQNETPLRQQRPLSVLSNPRPRSHKLARRPQDLIFHQGYLRDPSNHQHIPKMRSLHPICHAGASRPCLTRQRHLLPSP